MPVLAASGPTSNAAAASSRPASAVRSPAPSLPRALQPPRAYDGEPHQSQAVWRGDAGGKQAHAKPPAPSLAAQLSPAIAAATSTNLLELRGPGAQAAESAAVSRAQALGCPAGQPTLLLLLPPPLLPGAKRRLRCRRCCPCAAAACSCKCACPAAAAAAPLAGWWLMSRTLDCCGMLIKPCAVLPSGALQPALRIPLTARLRQLANAPGCAHPAPAPAAGGPWLACPPTQGDSGGPLIKVTRAAHLLVSTGRPAPAPAQRTGRHAAGGPCLLPCTRRPQPLAHLTVMPAACSCALCRTTRRPLQLRLAGAGHVCRCAGGGHQAYAGWAGLQCACQCASCPAALRCVVLCRMRRRRARARARRKSSDVGRAVASGGWHWEVAWRPCNPGAHVSLQPKRSSPLPRPSLASIPRH